MGKLRKKEIIELSIVAIILILAIYYEFILTPIINYNSNLSNQINQLNNKNSNINMLELTSKEYKSSISKISNDYSKSSLAIPINSKDAEIENTVNSLCTKDATILNSLIFNASTVYVGQNSKTNSSNSTNTNIKTGTLMMLPITVTISSKYDNILSFISDLEQNNRIFNITDYNIASDTSTGQLKAVLTIKCYYFTSDTSPNYIFNNGSYGKSELFN
jgi:Tfp pilus assembly protein PilO